MGLQGTLDTLPVLDALEALARLRREGLLEVRGGGSRATLSMVDGALVGGASLGPKSFFGIIQGAVAK